MNLKAIGPMLVAATLIASAGFAVAGGSPSHHNKPTLAEQCRDEYSIYNQDHQGEHMMSAATFMRLCLAGRRMPQ